MRVRSAWSRPSSTRDHRGDSEAQRAEGGAREQESPQDQRFGSVLHRHCGCSAYDDPRSSGDEIKRKAVEESDAVHTHEGEPMKIFEVTIPERDFVGVKSGVVLDPAKVQVARQ